MSLSVVSTQEPLDETKFGFVEGFPSRGGSIADVVGALRDLVDEDGAISAERVVAAAEAEDSPLHRYFTWDDAVAAHKFRVQEAQRLLRSIEVRVEADQNTVAVRAFHSVERGEHTYHTLAVVTSDEDRYNALLEDAWRTLHAFTQKYKVLLDSDLGPVLRAIEDALHKR